VIHLQIIESDIHSQRATLSSDSSEEDEDSDSEESVCPFNLVTFVMPDEDEYTSVGREEAVAKHSVDDIRRKDILTCGSDSKQDSSCLSS
jgi:hypothetical protein